MALNYATYGEPSAQALLLIHALGADLRFWEECGAILGSRYFCIAPDLRPAGSSPKSAVPVEIGQHLLDLDELRINLGIRGVVPVGCAMGGLVGAHCAARYPRSVRALVMANPGLRNTDAAKAMLRGRVEEIRKRGIGFLLPGAVDRAFHNLPQDSRYERYLSRFAAQDADAYVQSVLGFLDIDISGIAPTIACPTLLVPGEHDVLMAKEDGPRLRQILPRAELRPMRDTAHFVPFQAPDRFAAMVVEFLEALPARPPG
ncbi:MAG: alpha/beta fold hydrolase [Hyphomicrobiales bacterium]